MIEEKLIIAAEKLPVPQSTFKSVLERTAQEQKHKCLVERSSGQIMRGIIAIKDE